MKTPHHTELVSDALHRKRYSGYSLAALIERCAQGDADALREFHESRTPFLFNGQQGLGLVQFLDRLREAESDRWTGDVADEAYYVTIDKFSKLPTAQAESDVSKGTRGRSIDCRKYYQAFLRAFDARRGEALTPLEEEFLAGELMQGLVRRHYRLSLLECRRKSRPAMTRYVWRLENGRISLRMPRHIAGRERRKWLEQNVGRPNPAAPGIQERIQALIDQELGGQTVPLEEVRWCHSMAAGEPGTDPARRYSDSVGVDGLARAVATEKTDRIREQRPAIRSLGQAALGKLILRIFVDLSSGEYHEGVLAREFGLSKPTFSRFAGSRWKRNGAKSTVPDLWANTAQVLAHTEQFALAAKDAHVWESVTRILRDSPSEMGGDLSE